MYKLFCERTIACSHQLKSHNGKCKFLHGHNFKVQVTVLACKLCQGGSSDGMIIDFGTIKAIIDAYDHKHLNETTSSPTFKFQPTAERLSEILAKEIYVKAENPYIDKVTVRVYEAENQYAETEYTA